MLEEQRCYRMAYKTKAEMMEIICPSKEIRDYWQGINFELSLIQMVTILGISSS